MISQQTRTFLVTGVAIYLGYYLYYNNSNEDSSTAIFYTGNIPHVSLRELHNIKFNHPQKTNMDRKLKAFVLGATGAVGKELVKVLREDARFGKVTLIGRRAVVLSAEDGDNNKFENQLIDFEKLDSDESKNLFQGYDVGFSTLGTTRKKSGAEGFYRVDHDYVVKTAKLAKEGGCSHLHLVSSAGANKNAYFLYPKTKGEVEEELAAMDFPRLSIYRPAVLLVPGGREESRMGEALLQGMLRPFDRLRWFSIDVPMLARVMVANCFREASGKSEILDNAALNKFGKEIGEGGKQANAAANAGVGGKSDDQQPVVNNESVGSNNHEQEKPK